MLPKVYIFANDSFGLSDLSCLAVAEDGEVLAQHICSDIGYARHDLHDAEWRHNAYRVKFGQHGSGYEVVVLPVGEYPPDEVEARVKRSAPIPVED